MSIHTTVHGISNGTRKTTRFTTKDSNGAPYSWFFGYDSLIKAWILGDYTGYIRVLESTWRDSVPRIQMILANHGMTAEVN